MLDRDLESRRRLRLAARVHPINPHDESRNRYSGVTQEDRGILIGPTFGGIVLDVTKKRGPLCKALFEERLARLGLQGDYSTECIKWLGNE